MAEAVRSRARTPRTPLTRDRIVAAAMAVADASGLSAVSMRTVARELGVEAMSLYHHVDGKDAMLDAIAEEIFSRFPLAELGAPWRAALTERAVGARAVLSAHPWALVLLESRVNPGPSVLRQHDRVLGVLRTNGFDVPLAGHAFSAVDAYVYGFVLSESNLPFAPDAEPGTGAEAFAAGLALPADEYPYLTEFMSVMLAGRDYDYGDEFGYGLDLVLDQLEVRLAELRGETGPGHPPTVRS
ncbi:TetR/AcrR family transcriptional regulator [Agromyces sp. NBRC 114283]|uniref:TetR/AcrR family transcriptional regulator n=1 Tax=Agromyces sp. NBRC 114283 TaxID=2994521 RepID=UPI00249FEF93|nr:TetR/AcrR family transcriptional regulator [Agromyces sp. NBRC 114283]GLU90788.1 TetR family transcriptional regulator [Agromyces sp. NBRC 114283]